MSDDNDHTDEGGAGEGSSSTTSLLACPSEASMAPSSSSSSSMMSPARALREPHERRHRRKLPCTSGLPNCYCKSNRTRALERYVIISGKDAHDEDAEVEDQDEEIAEDGHPPGKRVEEEAAAQGKQTGAMAAQGGTEGKSPRVEKVKVLESYCGGADAARKLGASANMISAHLAGRSRSVRGHLLRFRDPLASPGTNSIHRANKKKSSTSSSLVACGTAEMLVDGELAGARCGHSLTALGQSGKSLYVFGGWGYATGSARRTGLVYLNDCLRFDVHDIGDSTAGSGCCIGGDSSWGSSLSGSGGGGGRWHRLHCRGAPPAKRAQHAAVAVGPYLAVSGGCTTNRKLPADLLLLHTPTLVWSSPTLHGVAPSPRMRPSLARVPLRANELLLFGGGPWQCLELTHNSEEHDGDVFHVKVK